ncbi:MAG: DUF2499 domain-containing protein [Chloroflexota bacterium]|nr:DUF2499 domain-containing protein [Chloroflexota bacterium]
MIGLLSIPTWIVHLGSIAEWSVAMLLFYLLGRKLNNVWLRRMPLVMIPYMLSGLCAIIYHITIDEWKAINVAQSYLTLIGSCCFALWAFLFLRSIEAELKQKPRQTPQKKEVQRG